MPAAGVYPAAVATSAVWTRLPVFLGDEKQAPARRAQTRAAAVQLLACPRMAGVVLSRVQLEVASGTSRSATRHRAAQRVPQRLARAQTYPALDNRPNAFECVEPR